MSQDRLSELRGIIGEAVQEWAELQETMCDEPAESIVVTCWALAFESANIELDDQGLYGGGVISPGGQSAAASRGLFHFGAAELAPRHHHGAQ